jgi:Zn-finger nucleic acid-binding protein
MSNCPVCSVSMKPDAYLNVSFEACPTCGGLWVNADEMTALLQGDKEAFAHLETKELPAEGHQDPAQPSWRCPTDGAWLQPYHYMFNSPVVLHNCPNCPGIFIEDGQLAQMQQVVDSTRQPMSNLEELKVEAAFDESNHEAYMLRQSRIRDLFLGFNRFRTGWFI